MKTQDVKIKLATVADQVTAHKDGTFTAKRGYFYRHGMTTEKFVEAIKANLPNIQVLEARDSFNPWPRDSFFMVKFQIKEAV